MDVSVLTGTRGVGEEEGCVVGGEEFAVVVHAEVDQSPWPLPR